MHIDATMRLLIISCHLNSVLDNFVKSERSNVFKNTTSTIIQVSFPMLYKFV